MNAQGKDSHAVYWVRFQSQINFSPKTYWNNEVDNRRFIDPDVQTQLIYHSRLHYKTGRWDYAGGLSLSWAYGSSPENSVQHPTLEARPVLEASYEIPYRKWLLAQRFRIDNRFFEEDKLQTIFDATDYILRLRYRLQARIPIDKNADGIPTVSLRIADEVMVNYESNFFDQNRVYVSGEFIINKLWSAECGYIHIYQQRLGTDLFLQRHVLRFSVLHKLSLYRTR
jgi:hypothetical protein